MPDDHPPPDTLTPAGFFEPITAARADRRADPRFAPRDGVTLDLWPDGPDTDPDEMLALLDVLALHDVSNCGLRVYFSRPLRAGRGVHLALRPPGGGPVIRRTGRVRWVGNENGIGVAAGIEFDRPLTDPERSRLAGT